VKTLLWYSVVGSYCEDENEMNATQLSIEFISLLDQAGKSKNFNCQPWYGGTRRHSRNILEITGSINCLIYYKVRSAEPCRWGVTANRLRELDRAGRRWFLVLLYVLPYTGYLISAEDVKRYLPIWPLGADGDYKVGTGSYLQFNRPFSSFSQLINSLTA